MVVPRTASFSAKNYPLTPANFPFIVLCLLMHLTYFDPATTPLLKGVNLIEASAGTGKTYAIAMLVLRFVVEQALPIDQILVVTFTKAATEELKDRVRQRLADAKRALTSDTHNQAIDANVVAWLQQLDIAPELIKQRLASALQDIDTAGIFTIHSFCQRMLREHALESGQLFDAELTDDLAVIKQACADDFWRKHIYPRSLWDAALLTADYKTPDALLASVDFIADHIRVYPLTAQALDDTLAELQQWVTLASAAQIACCATLTSAFADKKFKASYSQAFDAHAAELSAWLNGDSVQLPSADALALLTTHSVISALDGGKFRSNKSQSSEQRKADYLAELALNTAPFDALVVAIKQVKLALRQTLLTTLRAELDKRLQQLNVLSFDQLITRLSDALKSDKGALLAEELRQRFTAALIDEFQDTDDSQWFIFSTVFAVDSQYLYLIGDPKQAIYKFRGADIYSYLAAQQQAHYHFTLGKNWRSHPQLVSAVNALFHREQAFLLAELAFNPVEPAKSAQDGALYDADTPLAPMQLWQLPPSSSSTGYWTAAAAATEIRTAVVKEVVELLTLAYRLQPNNTALQPKDIAILVRTNAQAREYQTALREVGVPSVLNSTESVFASQEARDLYVVLQAVLNPSDSDRLKQALTLDWFGLDGQALSQLINDDSALDVWTARFLSYLQDWQKLGFMAMMHRLLSQEQVNTHLSTSTKAERQLTNLQHLIELVQQTAVDEHLGMTKTLSWLHHAITRPNNNESQQLRLESDDDAVQIVTMHRAKGLEYPVVFCPYLWQRSDRLRSEQDIINCHADGQMIADLGSDQFEQHRAQALLEELAEDLRLFYVAVTRAKYRCYLVWVDVRTQNRPNESAMAYLLNFADADFDQQQETLQAFSTQAAADFAYALLELAPTSGSPRYQKPAPDCVLQAQQRHRALYTNWQMSSYTALSALSLHDAPELPEDKARERQEQHDNAALLLPRGAHTGNVVHDLLENNAFIDLAQAKDISEQRDKACLRYGLKLEQPELLDALLQRVVLTPLAANTPDFCLMNLADHQCLKEMPFYLAMQTLEVSQINQILHDCPAFQPLTARQMRGYLTGFIDLVCQYNGQFYVMDYKTNGLPDYAPDTLTHAMREHNYGLQYWLYTVVLHRYLQQRLADYDYENHFGGVRYLFVRGMQPEIALSGVYQDRPELAKVEALATLIGGDLC